MLGYLFTLEYLRSMIYTLPAILIAISAHEFAHGYVSYKLGDPAPAAGRLQYPAGAVPKSQKCVPQDPALCDAPAVSVPRYRDFKDSSESGKLGGVKRHVGSGKEAVGYPGPATRLRLLCIRTGQQK